MERLAITSKRNTYAIGSVAGVAIGILSLVVGRALFRDGWDQIVAFMLGLSLAFITVETVIHFRLFDEERTFALTCGLYMCLAPGWALPLAHALPATVPAGSGAYGLVLLTMVPLVMAVALLAPRLHFTLADIRRLSAKRD